MRGWGRHPDGVSLSAWYDGEVIDPRVAAHVDRCERCWSTVRSFAAVDEAVRAGSRMSPNARQNGRATRARLSVGVAALAVAVLVVAVAPSLGPAKRRTEPERAAAAVRTSTSTHPSEGPATPAERPPGAPVAGGAATGPPAAATTIDPLVLGVPLPSGDPTASVAAAEVWHAALAAAAPLDGVEIVAVAAGGAVPGGVDALVGGWGTGAWDPPALVRAFGPGAVVVPGDPPAESAGRLLASAAVEGEEVIGVIRSTGADEAFGDGVAAARRTVEVDLAPGSSCEREVWTVVARGAVALALAAAPPEVRACLAALEASGIRPPRGVLVPPSLALDPEPPAPSGFDVIGLVGLPFPSSDEPGAVRFRQATGSRSYRALVTFAAVELAAGLTTPGATFSDGWHRQATWRSDLVRYEDGRNLGIHAVRSTPHGWRDHWGADTFSGDRREG